VLPKRYRECLESTTIVLKAQLLAEKSPKASNEQTLTTKREKRSNLMKRVWTVHDLLNVVIRLETIARGLLKKDVSCSVVVLTIQTPTS